jgi:hypothetical protein
LASGWQGSDVGGESLLRVSDVEPAEGITRAPLTGELMPSHGYTRSVDTSGDLQRVQVVLAHRGGPTGGDPISDSRKQCLPLLR